MTKKIKISSKVVIVGVGAVGTATAYAMANQQICNELVLVDVNTEKAEGEAFDINHAMPMFGNMKVSIGSYEDCADADIIVMTAGANRKPGETRLDLATKNAAITNTITSNIMKHYTDAIILIATNPVDVITTLVTKWTQLPSSKVIGSGTILDNARLRHELSSYLNVSVENVNGYVLGEHGDSQFISWDLTNISGVNVETFFKMTNRKFDDELKRKIAHDVKTGGATVISRKGVTNLGIAACITYLTHSILKNSNNIHTVCTVLDGLYGIKGVALGVLSVIGSEGVVEQLDYPLIETELSQIKYSAKQIQNVLDTIK